MAAGKILEKASFISRGVELDFLAGGSPASEALFR
jgi:hypothetical protein